MNYTEKQSLIEFLLGLMREVTGLSSDQLNQNTRFDEIGLQSLSVVAFTRQLSSFFPQLSQTFLYDCGNISEVAAYLEDRYGSALIEKVCGTSPEAETGETAQDTSAIETDQDWPELRPLDPALDGSRDPASHPAGDIAIVGMHGRFPGAPDLDCFWTNLYAGVDSVGEIPEDRWSLEGFYEPSNGQRKAGRSYSKWGGFLSQVDCFDAQFFGIAPREAALADPQERLFLECAWHAMESAALLGDRAADLKHGDGYDIGVFAGLTTNSYSLLGPDRWRRGDPDIPASMPWSAANRVSYCLDLSGPSLTVDTACSSSLVAVHLACESLLKGECAAALAGAANLYLHPAKYVQLCQQQMLSPTGHCHSFGEDADGFAPGEGVGVVVLKRLEDARSDGDRILAVIKGTAVNHNGRSNGYTVPRTRSQASLVKEALERAALPPERIGFVEAHGTGTKLGDPIEVSALAEVLGGKGSGQPCAIASVKSNIGHLESAAGIASLIKTVLQLQHRQIVPSLHATPHNPALALETTRFFVPETPQAWPEPADGELRAAGVSSFGAGGTNGHVVIEEAPAIETPTAAEGPMVFPLSARSAEQLAELAEQVLSDLAHAPDKDEEQYLPRLAYTLQCGLRHFEHRLCLVGETVDELEAQLQAFLSAQHNETAEIATPPYCGIAAILKADTDAVPASTDTRSLARGFVSGDPIDWRAQWQAGEPTPVEPPHYPFARVRHWLKPLQEEGRPAAPEPAEPSETIPVLEEHFVSIPATSSLLEDHKIGDRPLAPGTAYIAHCLDIVRSVADTWPFELHDLRWRRPVAADSDAAEVRLRVLCSRQHDSISFELEDVNAPGQTCFQGEAFAAAEPVGDAPSLSEARQACADPVRIEACYGSFAQADMHYGPRFRTLSKVWRSDNAFLAEIRRRYFDPDMDGEPALDPALLDGALHGASALLDEADLGAPLVPASLGRFRLHAPLGDEIVSYGIEYPSERKGEKRFDVFLFAPDGAPLAELNDLRFRHAPALKRHETKALNLHVLQPGWVEHPVPAPADPGPAIVLFDTDAELFRKLQQEKPDFAPSLRLVTPGRTFEVRGDAEIQWNSDDDSHAALLWRTLQADDRPIGKLVFNIKPEAACRDDALIGGHGDKTAAKGSVIETVETIRTLCRQASTPRFHIQMLLHGGEAASPAASALGGLLRSINLEIPTLTASVVTLPADANVSRQAVQEVVADPGAGVIERRWAGDTGFTLEIGSAEADASHASALFSADDVFIVTGGAGAVGRQLADELAERGVGKLALVGRGERTAEIESFLDDLLSKGCQADYVSADCGDRDSLSSALRRIEGKFGAPTGILHCAGVLQDGFFLRQNADDLLQSSQAKIAGAHWLDILTAQTQLRWFILCSGLAGIGGNIGQSHYAFANRWLDGFAVRRQGQVDRGERSGRTVSIVWPLWQTEDGMQGSLHLSHRLADAGLESISPAEGRALLMAALRHVSPVTVPIKGDLDKLGQFFAKPQPDRKPPQHSQSGESEPTVIASVSEQEPAWNEDREDAVEAHLLDRLKQALGEVTGTASDRIDPDAPMEVFGLDSIMVTELAGLLESDFPDLSKTAAFEARNLRDLAHLIMREHDAEARALLPDAPTARSNAGSGETLPEREDTVSASAAPNTGHGMRDKKVGGEDIRDEDIAIIGLAGQYPGAETLDGFWDRLAQGHDLVREVPPRWPDHAWPAGTPDDDAIYARWGSFLDDFDKFDPLFFGISPRDAERMDPQERLFLQTAWHAVEDAGYTPETLSGTRGAARRRVGVLAGVMYGEYQMYGAANGRDPSIPLTNSSYASIANRVSFCLDLDGPSLAVDSMCSSSLTAIHLACDLIRAKGCDLAIAGGVNLSLHPYKYRTLCDLGFASTDGRCRSFGEGGDGYVPGEGVGAVLLKPLRDALKDRDHVYAVIKGSDIGHGGRSSGYTVPNGEAQADVIARAFERAGEAGQRVSYVEAHGTGTSLGDPIEIRGLTRALKDKLPAGHRCPIGSVKSNIGHLESAAGIAAITKVLLQLRHGRIAPSIHAETLNPNIDFGKTPFHVQSELGDWMSPDGRPRVAAVSSFGAGGSNAHIVLEEMLPAAGQSKRSHEPAVFVFSGRNRAALIRNLERFATHLEMERQTDPYSLGANGYAPEEVAATLFSGRRWLTHRCAVVASSFPDLRDQLAWLLDNLDETGAQLQQSQAAERRAFIGEVENVAKQDEARDWDLRPEEKARAWVEGRLAQIAETPDVFRKVPLPGYTFDKRSFWIAELPAAEKPQTETAETSLPATPAEAPEPPQKEAVTPELILQKVDRGELDLAAAEALLESLMEAEKAA
ncbi:MAG: SDR family NAD(P)-dependent oxidoreductase [Methyloligella sp. ZOD6]